MFLPTPRAPTAHFLVHDCPRHSSSTSRLQSVQRHHQRLHKQVVTVAEIGARTSKAEYSHTAVRSTMLTCDFPHIVSEVRVALRDLWLQICMHKTKREAHCGRRQGLIYFPLRSWGWPMDRDTYIEKTELTSAQNFGILIDSHG